MPGATELGRRQGGPLHANGYQQITSLSSAASLTVPDGTKTALIVPTGQNVRWRDDGTAPTALIGMPLAAGESFYYVGDADAFAALQFIEEAGSAVLNITYYG